MKRFTHTFLILAVLASASVAGPVLDKTLSSRRVVVEQPRSSDDSQSILVQLTNKFEKRGNLPAAPAPDLKDSEPLGPLDHPLCPRTICSFIESHLVYSQVTSSDL
ncbi:MAG: hypothetical protein WBD36_07870 [Bacteroidota bacterium]